MLNNALLDAAYAQIALRRWRVRLLADKRYRHRQHSYRIYVANALSSVGTLLATVVTRDQCDRSGATGALISKAKKKARTPVFQQQYQLHAAKRLG